MRLAVRPERFTYMIVAPTCDDSGGIDAAASSPIQIAWNDERLDLMLAGISSLEPVAKTGLPTLDRLLSGGLGVGCHILSAIPGSGKTSFACQLADNIARFSNRKVLYFSCEMSAPSLLIKSITRLSAELSKEPLSFVEILALTKLLGQVDNPRVSLLLKTIEVYREAIAPNLATIDRGVSISSVETMLESCSAAELAPVAIIDYLQLLKSENGPEVSDYQALTATMRKCCELATKFKTALVAISSQNRTSSRGGADFRALSGSSEIEFGATTCAFLTVDDDEQRKPYVRNMTLTLAKSRFGQTGKVPLMFNPASSRFVETASEAL